MTESSSQPVAGGGRPISTGYEGYRPHFLRAVQQHHVQLSLMGDNKANLMITISALVLTLSVQYLGNPTLQYPAIIMMASCLSCMGFAVYATMPKRNKQLNMLAAGGLRQTSLNPLYFGHFALVPLEEFESVVEEYLSEGESTFRAQIRDIYQLGWFLHHNKYRWVRYSYVSLLAGLAASSITAVVLTILKQAAP
ncbi:hypothetical protein JW921_02875 [Candidatus Fermentibacterales bacterium]|nr:hypothetical protein [Candidatus Fermentibacterales bacterium]